MSLAAAQAMDDLAEALEQAAEGLSVRRGRPLLLAMAQAHRTAADRIRRRAEINMGGPVPVPPEFQEPGKQKR